VYIDNNSDEEMVITLYNSTGQMAGRAIKTIQKRTEIELNQLKNGIFWLKIEKKQGVFYHKIIKVDNE